MNSGRKVPEAVELKSCFALMIIAGILNIPELVNWYVSEDYKCLYANNDEKVKRPFYLFYVTSIKYTIHIGKGLYFQIIFLIPKKAFKMSKFIFV